MANFNEWGINEFRKNNGKVGGYFEGHRCYRCTPREGRVVNQL